MSDEPSKPRQPEDQARPTAPDGPSEAPTQQVTTPLDKPTTEQPATEQAAPEQTATGETTTEHGAEAPPPPPPPAPPAAPRQPGGFGRFARHRATQIVAAGLVGLVVGGGAVALLDRDGPRGGGFSNHGQFRGGPGPRGDFGPGRDFRDGDRGQRQRPPRQAPANPSTPSSPPSTTTPS